MVSDETPPELFRVLALDGGGAKGFYTLGVLHEIEAMAGPLHERFNLVYGTSTGAIIAALICLGYSVADIRKLYQEHVVKVMARLLPSSKSAALADLARDVFKDAAFTDVKTGIGIVCTKWGQERPMIFKASKTQAFGSKSSFVPGFGVPIGEAVQASCSAYPFFKKKTVVTSLGESIELGDGGFCANNPALYALADATVSMKLAHENVRLVSIGVGEYPSPKAGLFSLRRWFNYMFTVRLLQKTLEINTQSMDQLRIVLFKDIKTVRISQAYTQPEMATDMFEHNTKKLDELWQRGRRSFEGHEPALKEYLL
ncbi:MAG: patatin-like phospholipase family protein [Reyranella sp.]|jgi:patatin-like phospholipase/acyl hydrolase|nr:patatin-like phospholipase family protein [Reyranella sp.]